MINILNTLFQQQGLTDPILLQEEVMFDIETYPNYFNVTFLFRDKYTISFEMKNDEPCEYLQGCAYIVSNFVIVGYNSNNYDIPMLQHFLSGRATNTSLYELSKRMVEYGERWWHIRSEYEVFEFALLNTYDLIEIAPDPARVSLKTYAARLMADNLQDLPYEPHQTLTDEEIAVVANYCRNDVVKTKLLRDNLTVEIDMRKFMSDQFGMDLRSLSDAQIGERVSIKLCERRLGRKIQKPDIKQLYPRPLKYYPPEYLTFEHPTLQKALELVRNAEFMLDKSGKPIIPQELNELQIIINHGSYNLQIGGLHSQETSQSVVCRNGWRIKDIDVDSFYPRIIINNKYFPRHIGEVFQTVYEQDLVEPRLDYKHKAADETLDKEERKTYKQLANSMKIVINGTYGKFGSIFSMIYAPELMLSVCMTGQLSLLMLIERFEKAGIRVLSANTDGIVTYYHESQEYLVKAITKQWEKECNFTTEENYYQGLHSKDVNNYIAFKSDENCVEIKGVKQKGVYTDYWYRDINSFKMKNTPDFIICRHAVLDYLQYGKPISDTITECDDLLKFTSVRNVNGGGTFRGKSFGRVARFYKSKTSRDCLKSEKGDKVPKSSNAELCLNLPKTLPSDIDYKFYIDYAEQILYDIGYKVKNRVLDLF